MRRGTVRLAAAVLASGLVAGGAITAAGPAAADDGLGNHGGAAATLGGLKTFDQAVIREGGKDEKIGAGLFEMSVDNGGTLQSYCIDIRNPTQEQAKYQEVPWSASSLHNNDDAGKIRWILQHSYPQINDLAQLAEAAGAGTLSEKTAAAGTQVAIWRYSDHIRVDAVDPEAEKLADHLYKAARDVAEPKASLTLDPPAVSGKSGERLGPLMVRTNASSVTIAPPATTVPSGVRVVSKNGKPVTRAVNGTKLFLDVRAGAADGTAQVMAEAATKVPVGRAFTGIGQHAKSQTQILAGSSESTVSAEATVNWAKKGAIPALSAKKNCAKGGVDIMVSNRGDEPFMFTLAGQEHTVAAGTSETTTVPVQEDEAYKITITGPNGFEETFAGMLDCKTASSSGGSTGGATDSTPDSATAAGNDQPSSKPSPVSAGGSTGETSTTEGGDLADTGSSSPAPLIAGIAAAMVAVGGGTVLFLRKKKATPPSE
ncbi:TQXA domain-containing protein/LPXTG-motif cell wall-anchored protein [Streptomyces zagrosensis]|uniref:TQXA domain-containing protein/LPXTG-motif cell wall-anchored protein n=2 Tax=Streptomyces zagrosensis TaxID=1042984 RepID=A0A7W9Q7W3_9ACTN|nr:TQXA domain-containing protein/LPXTG-motif cell wall-anchored protein [Streptomyces zagrosensis]